MNSRHLLLAGLVFVELVRNAPAQSDVAFTAYQAQIAAAEKSLRLNETRELRRWLEATDRAYRDWEWAHLDAVADTSTRHVPMADIPSRIEMAPAGDRLATVEDSRVLVLSWPGLEELAVIDGHTDAVYRASFSPDGRRLITVARDVTSRTWNADTGAEIARMELANPAFAACAFDPTGGLAATCAWERVDGEVFGLVWIWDPATGEVRHRKRIGIKPLSSIRFTPDGSRLVVGSWDGLLHVLDLEADEIARLVLPDEGIYNAVNDIAISPDGRFVAAGTKDRTTRVFALETGELVASLRGHGGFVEGAAFSPDGAMLATCSIDATVILWNTDDWSRRTILRGPTDTVRGVAWSADGRSIAACALDGNLWTWSSDTNDASTTVIDTGQDGIYSAALSPDGSTVAVACFDGWLRTYDSRTGELAVAWEAHPGSTCHAAAYSGDGDKLITASWDQTARIWNPREGGELAVLETGEGVYAATISPDGARAATSGSTLQIWDVDEAQRLHTISIDDAQPQRIEFSSDGALLASAWTDGYARIHDSNDGTLIATLGDGTSGGAGVQTVAFLPGDERIATGDAAGVVRVFPARGGEASFATDTGGRGVNHLACAGGRIAVATDRLWLIDAERGGIVLGLSPHEDTIWALDWSPDGRRLATCAIAGVIRILER